MDHLKGGTKPTCLIHGPSNSSDECKVLGGFSYKYAISRPTKDYRHYRANINKLNRKKENNAFVKQLVSVILLQENIKVSAEEAHENIESYFDDNDLYQIENMSLDDKKENIE